MAHALCATDDPALLATTNRHVDVTDAASREQATAWWVEMTVKGRVNGSGLGRPNGSGC